MELVEAISILEDEKQEIFDIATGVNEKWKEAYKTVIQVAKNSIPKEKVEKIFETKIYNTKYLAKTDWTDYQKEVDCRVASMLEVIKQEVLEE